MKSMSRNENLQFYFSVASFSCSFCYQVSEQGPGERGADLKLDGEGDFWMATQKSRIALKKSRRVQDKANLLW